MSGEKFVLYSEYAEYQGGRKEVTTTYQLRRSGTARDAVLTIEVQRDQREFPDGESSITTQETMRISAVELIELVRKHTGRSP